MSTVYIHKTSRRKAEKIHTVNNMDENKIGLSVVYRFCDGDVLFVCSLNNFNKWFEEIVEFQTKDGFTINEGDYYYYNSSYQIEIRRTKARKDVAEFISNNGYKLLENLQNTLRYDAQQEHVEKINKINGVVFTID